MIIGVVHDILQRGQISDQTCHSLTSNIDKTQQSYMLPKFQ